MSDTDKLLNSGLYASADTESSSTKNEEDAGAPVRRRGRPKKVIPSNTLSSAKTKTTGSTRTRRKASALGQGIEPFQMDTEEIPEFRQETRPLLSGAPEPAAEAPRQSRRIPELPLGPDKYSFRSVTPQPDTHATTQMPSDTQNHYSYAYKPGQPAPITTSTYDAAAEKNANANSSAGGSFRGLVEDLQSKKEPGTRFEEKGRVQKPTPLFQRQEAAPAPSRQAAPATPSRNPLPGSASARVVASAPIRNASAATLRNVAPAPIPSHGSAPLAVAPRPAAPVAAPASAPAPAAAAPACTHSAQQQEKSQQPPKVLICWVGKVDISAALRHDKVNPGPVRMLLERAEPFDHILLLTTQNQGILDAFRQWLLPCVEPSTLDIRRTAIRDLTDHTLICGTVMDAVEMSIQNFGLDKSGKGIVFHLSPGTPATHAVLILLAIKRYPGIRLVQTKLPGLGQQPEVLDVKIPALMLQPACDTNEPPVSVSSCIAVPHPLQQNFLEMDDSELSSPLAASASIMATGAAHPQAVALQSPSQQAVVIRRPATASDSVAATPAASAPEAPKPENAAEPAAESKEAEAMETAPYLSRYGKKRYPGIHNDAGYSSFRSGKTVPGQQPGESDPPSISESLGRIYKKMCRIAPMYLPILLLGESGSGKSRLAFHIHCNSGRPGKFINFDCAGLSDEMFTCELFGQKPGDYPGAWRVREGAFRQANNGTIFLENVGDLTPSQQTLLLRVLSPAGETVIQLPSFGSHPACTVRVRVIASANKKLISLVRQGQFRTDLYYRLAGVSATLPPVREYTLEERENLLRSFLVRLQTKFGQCWNFSGDAWQALVNESWPGNLREVSRMLQQICLCADVDQTISREDVLRHLRQGRVSSLPEEEVALTDAGSSFGPSDFEQKTPAPQDSFGPVGISGGDEDADSAEEEEDKSSPNNDFFVLGSGNSLDAKLHEMKMEKIAEALRQTGGNRAEAAKLLGLSYVQLSYTLRQQKKELD